MSRDSYRGPKLPKFLLDQVHNTKDSRFKANVSRKDRRKAERQQKKQASHSRNHVRSRQANSRSQENDNTSEYDEAPVAKAPSPVRSTKAEVQPLKSILKPSNPAAPPKDSASDLPSEPTISRRTKERLEDDDAEIAALEKKLGIKGKKSKALQEDGLDWIAGEGLDSEDEERGTKRKRPEDVKWLRDKRLKAGATEDIEEPDGSEDETDIENPFSDDEVDGDGFDGFGSEDDEDDDDADDVQDEPSKLPKKQRENPYVPPTALNTPAAKYVPPSLRAPPTDDEEILKQLRRQIQGLLNRLAEPNLISIVRSLEELYGRNARQHVTSTVVDLLVALVADAAVLNDTFLVLHAGFAAAVYKIVGTDFGAQFLEKLVKKIDQYYTANAPEGKEALNLLAFLCNLYTFQVVGSPIVFDYIRLLLDELSENNTELLLRVIRNCGQALRQDDPSALKDVVLLLQRSVAKVGESNVSVRTKFMIETINDLKNNRMKAASSSVVAAEQTTRMKKTLASLNNSRSFKSAEPLSITLSDIRNSDKKGKWWLIGASYHDPAKLANKTSSNKPEQPDPTASDAGSDSDPNQDLNSLARTQGMNTAVRRSIFTTILSSIDYNHAHMQLIKLHLKNKQQLEIPRVLVHCVKAEDAYNPFYALVAMKFCGEHRMRKAFEFALWDFFRKLEAQEDGEEVGVREVVNMGKFYGTLVAEGGLKLGVLKKLDFAPLGQKEGMFLEVFLTTIMTLAKKPVGRKKVKDEEFDQIVRGIFMQTAGDVAVIRGLREVIETQVEKADLATGEKEKRVVEKGCEIALEALDQAARKDAPVPEDSEDGSE